MFNFLHTFSPEPILITLGPLHIYWYGIFIVSGILAAILIILKLADFYRLDKNTVIDAVFYLIIGGIIGARFYHVMLEWPYYLERPLAIFKIWQGGLAIHGAIIAGVIITYWYARRLRLPDNKGGQPKTSANFWFLSSLFATGLALAQAIGRWGNYFNQELFGLPTNLPWGIPISPANRLLDYYNAQYFHPAFLYESIGNFFIFAALLLAHYKFIKGKKTPHELFLLLYLVLYSLLRFFMEFVRIDTTPRFIGLRWPQIMSLIILILALGYFIYLKRQKIAKAAILEKN